MGTPYQTAVGTPPVCTSLAFLDWRDELIEYRLAECPIPRGTTRYVDFTLGNDSNAGTEAAPWKTVAKVNTEIAAAATNANLAILFKRGEIWRMSGLDGVNSVAKNNITIGAYGTGNRPQLTWFNTISQFDWSLTSGRTITYERTEASSVAWVREQNSFDAVLVKRTTVDAVEANPGSWYWDGSKLYISAQSAKSPYTHQLPTNSGLIYEVVYNNTGYGIACTGDSVRIDNVRVDGAGCVTTAQNLGGYGIWWAPVTPTDCCVVSNCESYYNQAHNIGTTTTGSGGFFTAINCRAGWMSGTASVAGNTTSGTVYVSYAQEGGNEGLWVGNCNAAGNLPAAEVAYVTLNSAGGILMHASGGVNIISMGLAHGTYNDTPEYQVVGLAGYANVPPWTDLADCRAWITNSRFTVRAPNAADVAAGGVTIVGNALMANNCVGINGYLQVRSMYDASPSGNGRYAGGFSVSNQVLINTIIDVDWQTNVPSSTSTRALWYGGTDTNIELYNSAIITRVAGRSFASVGFLSGTAIKIFNSIVVGYAWVMRMTTRNHTDQLKNNAYINLLPGFRTDATNGWSNDTTGVSDPAVYSPTAVSPSTELLSASQYAVKGYNLEYDYYEQPRIVAATARGPVEAFDSEALRYGTTAQAVILQSYYPTVSRNVTDETPILFTWPSASATITVTRSIDAGSYGAATGAAAFAYTQDGQHFYSLAYSANDRPAGAGSVVYRLNDGGVVRLLPLQVEVGGGGGAAVNVLPAVGITAERSPGVTLNVFVGETVSQSITIYQTDGVTPFPLTGKTLVIIFETRQGTDVATVTSGSITIGGDEDNVVTFAYPSAATAAQRVLKFAIRDASAPKTVYLQGLLNVQRAPQVD